MATLVLTIGIVALFANYTSSQKLGTSAESHQTAVAIAEGELEHLHGLKWGEIAMTSEPTRSSESGNPTNYEVSPETTACAGNGPSEKAEQQEHCYEWNWSETTTREPLVISAEGAIKGTEDPKTVTETTTAGGASTRLTFSVYSFITWANDSSCTAAACKGEEDTKRIIIAVTGSNLNKPVTLVSLINDAQPATNPVSSSTKCEEESGTKTTCFTQ